MSYSNYPTNPPQQPISTPPPYYAGGYSPSPGAMVPYAPHRPVVAAKTPGIAILLSLLWLGAGHLYANRIGTGIALMSVEAMLALLSLTGVGLIIAIPIWLVLLPIVMITASGATTRFNQQHGI